jgi:hypothetical protein
MLDREALNADVVRPALDAENAIDASGGRRAGLDNRLGRALSLDNDARRPPSR